MPGNVRPVATLRRHLCGPRIILVSRELVWSNSRSACVRILRVDGNWMM